MDYPEQQQLGAINTPDDLTQRQSLLHSLANYQYQHEDDRVKMIQFISRHLEPALAGEAPSIMLTRFVRRHNPNSVNQVSPQGNSLTIQDQLSNHDVRKMVRISANNEPLPNHENFPSSFFQKFVKKEKTS